MLYPLWVILKERGIDMENSGTKFCKYCGEEISNNAKYCKKCGCEVQPMQFVPQKGLYNKMITCKTCGAQIAYTAKACPHCGAKPTNRLIGEAIVGTIGGLLAVPFIIIAIILFVVFIRLL